MKKDGSAKLHLREESEDINSSVRALKISTICDKDELKWPVRLFGLNLRRGSLKFLSLLKIKNILSLILQRSEFRQTVEKG